MRTLAALSAALSAASVILAAACGGTAATVDPGLGRVIEVTMTEFKFSPSTITLAPGEKVVQAQEQRSRGARFHGRP